MTIEIYSTEILPNGDTKFRFLVDGVYSKILAVINMNMLQAKRITPERHIEILYSNHIKNGYLLSGQIIY